jgi:hypothetical protein
MLAKIEYLKIQLENSTEIDAILEDITSNNLPETILSTIEKCRDDGLEGIDMVRYQDHVLDMVRDGKNLIDLYVEMKAIEHQLTGEEGLEHEANTIAKAFWKSIEKALR